MNKIDKRTTIALSAIFVASTIGVILLQIWNDEPIIWERFGFIVALMAGVFAFIFVFSLQNIRKITAQRFFMEVGWFLLLIAVINNMELMRTFVTGKGVDSWLLSMIVLFLYAGLDVLRRARLLKKS